MLKQIARKIFGNVNDRIIASFEKHVKEINELEPKFINLTNDELKAKTFEFKEKLQQGHNLDQILPHAFAACREAAKRVLGERHYDVQLIGGIAMHKGYIAEMKTGEGKTLVSTLPAYLNALTEKGVHIVTVNDYLAKRDSEWMGQVFHALGLSVGCIFSNMDESERQKAYQCDITYGTNNEFGFDYLRDHMKFDQEDMVRRNENFAIIDEIDSILIDEARTPLIISGAAEDSSELYLKINKIIPQLTKDHYDLDEKSRNVMLNEEGTNSIEKMLREAKILPEDSHLYDMENISIIHHVNQSLKAHKLFKKDVDYLVRDNQVMIIDEFTGRLMSGRRYSEGLHQALEAKENVAIQRENQTLASITFQNYFRLYDKLAGMSGTAATEASEFKDIYNLDVVSIPTNIDITRIDDDDSIYATIKEKYDAILAEVKKTHETGQPILVGTVNIEQSEYISALFKKNKIKHNVLNAKNHEKEAQIIAQAGRFNAVTIATNMAGRGTDIKLGGNLQASLQEYAEKHGLKTTSEISEKEVKKISQEIEENKAKVLEVGGLFVLGTERHESRRIDNQLRGRSGRQGDPGRTKFYLSLEDDLMRLFASEKMSNILQKMGLRDGESIQHPMISRSLVKAQQKVEARNYEIRKNLLKFDDVMNEQRKVIFEQREDIISSADVSDVVEDFYSEINERLVSTHIPAGSFHEQWQLDSLKTEFASTYGINFDFQKFVEESEITEPEILQKINELVSEKLTKKEQEIGSEIMRLAEKKLLLITIDQFWKEHLSSLDHLRQGISLRAYGQKDPLNEYKKESFNLFSQMLDEMQTSFISHLAQIEFSENNEDYRINSQQKTREIKESGQTMHKAPQWQQTVKSTVAPEDRDKNDPSTWGKVARNEACPCESGKKFKQCHGKLS